MSNSPPPPAIGSQADMVNRLAAVLPTGWFPSVAQAPVLGGLLAGIASIWAFLWSLLSYVTLQKRITTATDINLDLISNDFLGLSLPRNAGESDASFRARIQATIFQEMGTREAVIRALTTLTGGAPSVFEPRNAFDTGGRGASGGTINTGLGYGVAGGYGSYQLPFQAFIQTTLPQVIGTIGVQGYGSPSVPVSGEVIGGYGVGALEYSSGSAALLSASDDAVFATINTVKPIATIMWVSTTKSNPQTSGGGTPVLDSSFILDTSRLG